MALMNLYFKGNDCISDGKSRIKSDLRITC